MSVPRLVDSTDIKAGAVFRFRPATVEQLERYVDEFFDSEGYRLEKGESGDGVYARGNPLLRLLLGAFHKRFAFRVLVDDAEDGGVDVEIQRGETGFAGGAIGRRQVVEEEKRILDEFEEWARNGWVDGGPVDGEGLPAEDG